jgi:hypothetical protein
MKYRAIFGPFVIDVSITLSLRRNFDKHSLAPIETTGAVKLAIKKVTVLCTCPLYRLPWGV